jgi:hypothetical protein
MRKRTRWVISLGCLVCLAVCGFIAWDATRPNPPIRDFYARIQPGMTQTEVQAVFGSWWDCPRRSTRPAYTFIEGEVTPGAGLLISWDWYDRAVLLRFDGDGRLREKAFASVEWVAEPWDRRIRRLIGVL